MISSIITKIMPMQDTKTLKNLTLSSVAHEEKEWILVVWVRRVADTVMYIRVS
jgi:hypothetical protein